MKTFQEFITEMRVIGGKFSTALSKHYSSDSPAHFSTLANHKNVKLKDAHDIMKDANPGKTDDELHQELLNHFKKS